MRSAPRVTRTMEATVDEAPPPGAVVVVGSGKIGSSALHLAREQKQTSMLVMTAVLFSEGKVASSTLKQEFGCSSQAWWVPSISPISDPHPCLAISSVQFLLPSASSLTISSFME